MISVYQLSGHLHHVHGYTVVDTDFRNWCGWTWLKMRTAEGALVVYRNKGR